MDQKDRDLLIRIDERTENTANDIAAYRDEMASIKKKVDKRFERIEKRFAAKWVERFNIGFISTVMVAVLLAIVNTVVKAAAVFHRGD